jgi:hypothetical protein
MHAIARGSVLLMLNLLSAPAGATVFVISFFGDGYVSVNGGPESALGTLRLTGYGDTLDAVENRQTPSLPSSYDVTAPLQRLSFTGPGIAAEARAPGAFVNSRPGGPTTQFASLDGTQLRWPFSIPARWPLDLVSFSGSAFAYQPVAPFVTSAGDVIAYRYATEALTFSGGPSSLPPVPEPATVAMLGVGLALLLPVHIRPKRPARVSRAAAIACFKRVPTSRACDRPPRSARPGD